MFESGSRRSYSFRPDSLKTTKVSKSHSLTRASAGQSVAGSIVATDDHESRVILKSRSSFPVTGQTSNGLLTSTGEPVQDGKSSSVVLRPKTTIATNQSRVSTEGNKIERCNGSLILKNRIVTDVERAEPRCEPLHDTTADSCTKTLPNATNGQRQQDDRRRSASSDPDWTRSTDQWSAEVVRESSSDINEAQMDRQSMKSSPEDKNATEINNNFEATKLCATDNAVVSDSSLVDHSVDTVSADDDQRPSLHCVDLAATAANVHLPGQRSGLTVHQSTGHFGQHSSDEQLDDQSTDQSADHLNGLSDDHLSDHSADHITDHWADHPYDHSVNPSADYLDDLSTDHVTDHVTDQIIDHSAQLSSNQIENRLSHLHIDSATSDYKTTIGASTITRNFDPLGERDAVAAESEHPYFARIAAEAAEPTPIISNRGTVRGVRNRVKSGIASLLEKQNAKKTVNYAQVEKGRIVLYTTSVHAVRETFEKCLQVKKILQTQMVDFEERNIFVSKDLHQELIERLQQQQESALELPQVFVDGYHLGGSEEIERLNESGVLRKIFNNFKKVQHPECCSRCGGYRYIPCTSCHGSKKSRRNYFTNEFFVLRCTSCDENGLVKCEQCNITPGDNDQPVMASSCF